MIYELFGMDFVVVMLSKMCITITGIIMPNLKLKGKF